MEKVAVDGDTNIAIVRIVNDKVLVFHYKEETFLSIDSYQIRVIGL